MKTCRFPLHPGTSKMAEAAGEECVDESEVLNDFADICAEPPKTRDKCEKCK